MLMVLLPILAIGKALHYNLVVLQNDIPMPAWVTMGVALLGFYAITAYRYWMRYRWLQTITGYTRYGVALILDGLEVKTRAYSVGYGSVMKIVDKVIDDAMVFWTNWAVRNTSKHRSEAEGELRESWVGTILALEGKVIHAVSSSGPMPDGFPEYVLGIHYLNQMAVTWDGEVVKTVVDMSRILRHEVGHHCLEALGVYGGNTGENHHAIFDKTKYEE